MKIITETELNFYLKWCEKYNQIPAVLKLKELLESIKNDQ